MKVGGVKIGDAVKLGLRTVAYKALDSSNKLNNLANRISGGSVNRDKLAQRIFTDAVALGTTYAASSGTIDLGKRTADIVNKGGNLLFDNTKAEVDKGVGPLVELLIGSKGQGEYAQKLGADIAQRFLGDQLGDHALERIFSALGQQKGGEEVLKLTLDNALAGFTGGKMISGTVMSIIKRAAMEPQEYKDTTFLHQSAAWLIHFNLAPEGHELPASPIVPGTGGYIDLETAMKGASALSAAAPMAMGAYSYACNQADSLQKMFGIQPKEQSAEQTFTDAWGGDFAVTENMAPKEFARVAVMANTLGKQDVLNKNIDAISNKEVRAAFTEQRDAINALSQRLPDAKVVVAPNWSGGLEHIAAERTTKHNPSGALFDFAQKQANLPAGDAKVVGNYTVDGAFLDKFQAGINLTLDNSQRGYAEMAADFGNQAFLMARSFFGYTDPLTSSQQQQLQQLSKMVKDDPESLQVVTSYLNPDNVLKGGTLEKHVLNTFEQRKEPNLIFSNNVWMQLGEPEVSFNVTSDESYNIDLNSNITVNTTVKWPVLMFGKSPETLEKSEDKSGSLSVTNTTGILFQVNNVVEKSNEKVDIQLNLKETLKFAEPAPPAATKLVQADDGLFD